MTQKEAISYWKKSAEENRKAAEDVFKANHPEWGFFLYHLALEKLLKGLTTKKGVIPPPIHNLVNLCKVAGIKIDEQMKEDLKEINDYNIEARYEDYKRKYYQKVTNIEYGEKWQAICNNIFIWLKEKF